MKKSRHLTGKPVRQNTLLDSNHLQQLDQIAPDNISEAIRFCVQFALERGALAAALAQHTPQQRAAYLERYHQPQPIQQLYNGQPIQPAQVSPAPAPQPVDTQAAQINTAPPPSTSAPILAAVQQIASQVSPADMLAYAKSFCPDEEIDAARLELEQMEAAARMQRNN